MTTFHWGTVPEVWDWMLKPLHLGLPEQEGGWVNILLWVMRGDFPTVHLPGSIFACGSAP